MQLTSGVSRLGKSLLLTGGLLLFLNSAAMCADYYAAPTGNSAGNGSLAKPWDLVTALNASSVIKPGDTLWLRGGTYSMRNPAEWMPTISGTSAKPIIVRRYPNEWVVLDEGDLASAFYVMPGSHDVWYWGLEFTATGIPRSTSASGPWSELDATIEIHGQGTKFINCYVHDLSQAFSFWQDAINSELYGNVVLDNGWNAADRAHGHNAYVQNMDTGTKTLDSNFFIAAFDVGVQAYGTGAATIAHIYNRNNIYADNGAPVGLEALQLVIGNGVNKHDIEVGGNWFYTSPQIGTGLIQIGWSWDVQNGDSNIHDNFVWGPGFQVWHWDAATVVRNQVYGGQTYFALYDKASPTQSLSKWTIDNNTYASNMTWVYAVTGQDSNGYTTNTGGNSTKDLAVWKTWTGLEAHSTAGASVPATYKVLPNKYEAGRANIVITNPGAKLSSVAVDLSNTGLNDGDKFEIHDAQNFRGPAVVTGTYLAASPTVNVPMTNLLRKRISGWSNTPPHTAPYFGTFVLLGGAALDGSSTYTPPTGPPSDTVAPTAVLSTIAQSVTGSITLTATATDNVGVTGVQFLLDGANLGVQQSNAPYSISWDTTQASNGQHTLTAVAYDAAGNRGTSAAVAVTVNNVAVTPPPVTTTATATFMKSDATTQGSWKPVYGSEGAVIVNDSATLPSYGTVAMKSGSAYTWSASATDVRAVQKAAATDRIASTWFQSAFFSIDVNLTDSNTHQVALYLLDWDNNARVERIDVTDAGSGTVLDSRNASNFVNGQYLVWTIKGHVIFKVTKTSGGSNGVVSAVFFGAGTGTVVTPPSDTTPPTISVTSPLGGSTLNSTVVVSAMASDNVAVAGVQFKVDGASATAEQTAAPYSFSLDTTKLTNASHTISATARDAAGNVATASVTVTVSNASTPPVTAKVPVLYWTLDKADVQNLNVIDKTAGTPLVMSNVTAVPGHLGDAMTFNGTNSSLVGYTSASELTTHLTIAAWIKTSNKTGAETIVSKYDSSGSEAGYLFHVNSNGALGLRLGAANGSNGSIHLTDIKPVNDGQWHHVAVVITIGQDVSFYVDGVLTSRNTCKSTVASSGVPLDIGNDTFGYYGLPFNGTIDEFKIFRSALTAADIAVLAQ